VRCGDLKEGKVGKFFLVARVQNACREERLVRWVSGTFNEQKLAEIA
jgi:hypothetical protein